MNNVSSSEAYKSDLPSLPRVTVEPYIDGKLVSSKSNECIERFNPSNGRHSHHIPAGDQADVERAVQSSRSAFEDGRWSNLAPSARREILNNFAKLIENEAYDLDRLDALDMGKPVSLAAANASGAAGYVRYCADSLDSLTGDVYASDSKTFVAQLRLPRGIVAAITPWNFPTMNAVVKLAPSLATGNCVVLKPSENASRSAMRLAELAIEAGLPPGVLNLVPGRGSTVGRALALHNDVNMLTFTGSTTVGKLMLQYAGQSNMKLVHAECGGKSPQIVFADYEDIDTVANSVADFILVNQGQVCVAGSRLLVQKEIESVLIDKIVARLKTINPGDAMDANVNFGPVATQEQLQRILSYIAAGKRAGAELVHGGGPILVDSGGYFVSPTLFKNVDPHARIAQEEIFGPVLSVTSFESDEEAVRIANGTPYGLAAQVWTGDLARGMRLSKTIRAGSVSVYTAKPQGEAGRAISTEPYGQSGVGVEGGQAGLEAYQRRQTTWFSHG